MTSPQGLLAVDMRQNWLEKGNKEGICILSSNLELNEHENIFHFHPLFPLQQINDYN